MIAAGVIPGPPVDPTGVPFTYDAASKAAGARAELAAAAVTAHAATEMTSIELTLLAIFGLMIGSFLNVCISRSRRGSRSSRRRRVARRAGSPSPGATTSPCWAT
jgi:hypothetical protein